MPVPSTARLARLRLWLGSRDATLVAWFVWLLLFFGASIRAVCSPSGVTKIYRYSAYLWQTGQDLYADGIHGFLYLPHCAVLCRPLLWGNFFEGEIGWRLGTVALFAWSVYWLCRLVRRHTGVQTFALVTLLGIWPVLGSAGNGQCNLPMASCLMLAAVACAERRFWIATAALMLATAFKPLALVMVLLAGAVHWRQLGPRLLVGLVVLFAVPFALQSPDYVWRQYVLAVTKMGVSGSTENAEFLASDLSGLLASFGIETEPRQLMPVRAAAALLTLWLAWLGRRRWPEPQASLLLLALSTGYLMVFNPRTESNTYSVVAPAIAVLAAWRMLVERRAALLPVTVLLGLGLCNVFRPLVPGPGPQFWLKPGLVLLFLGHLAWQVLRGRPPVDARGQPSPDPRPAGALGVVVTGPAATGTARS